MIMSVSTSANPTGNDPPPKKRSGGSLSRLLKAQIWILLKCCERDIKTAVHKTPQTSCKVKECAWITVFTTFNSWFACVFWAWTEVKRGEMSYNQVRIHTQVGERQIISFFFLLISSCLIVLFIFNCSLCSFFIFITVVMCRCTALYVPFMCSSCTLALSMHREMITSMFFVSWIAEVAFFFSHAAVLVNLPCLKALLLDEWNLFHSNSNYTYMYIYILNLHICLNLLHTCALLWIHFSSTVCMNVHQQEITLFWWSAPPWSPGTSKHHIFLQDTQG